MSLASNTRAAHVAYVEDASDEDDPTRDTEPTHLHSDPTASSQQFEHGILQTDNDVERRDINNNPTYNEAHLPLRRDSPNRQPLQINTYDNDRVRRADPLRSERDPLLKDSASRVEAIPGYQHNPSEPILAAASIPVQPVVVNNRLYSGYSSEGDTDRHYRQRLARQDNRYNEQSYRRRNFNRAAAGTSSRARRYLEPPPYIPPPYSRPYSQYYAAPYGDSTYRPLPPPGSAFEPAMPYYHPSRPPSPPFVPGPYSNPFAPKTSPTRNRRSMPGWNRTVAPNLDVSDHDSVLDPEILDQDDEEMSFAKVEKIGLSVTIHVKKNKKMSTESQESFESKKQANNEIVAWRQPVTVLTESGSVCELLTIHALEYKAENNKQGKTTLICPGGPQKRESDSIPVQLRWLHVQRTGLDLQILQRLVLNCPFIPNDLIAVAITLLDEVESRFGRTSESGSYLEMGAIIRYIGRYTGYLNPEEPKETEPVLFFSAPYVSLQPPVVSTDGYHSRTLLQSLYGYDMEEKIKGQIVQKIFRRHSKDLIHADQLWCLLIGTNILITMSDRPLREIQGDAIETELRSYKDGELIVVRLIDDQGQRHHSVVDTDYTYVDLLRHAVTLIKGDTFDALEYDLLDTDGELLTSEKWLQILSTSTTRVLDLYMKGKRSYMATSRTAFGPPDPYQTHTDYQSKPETGIYGRSNTYEPRSTRTEPPRSQYAYPSSYVHDTSNLATTPTAFRGSSYAYNSRSDSYYRSMPELPTRKNYGKIRRNESMFRGRSDTISVSPPAGRRRQIRRERSSYTNSRTPTDSREGSKQELNVIPRVSRVGENEDVYEDAFQNNIQQSESKKLELLPHSDQWGDAPSKPMQMLQAEKAVSETVGILETENLSVNDSGVIPGRTNADACSGDDVVPETDAVEKEQPVPRQGISVTTTPLDGLQHPKQQQLVLFQKPEVGIVSDENNDYIRTEKMKNVESFSSAKGITRYQSDDSVELRSEMTPYDRQGISRRQRNSSNSNTSRHRRGGKRAQETDEWSDSNDEYAPVGRQNYSLTEPEYPLPYTTRWKPPRTSSRPYYGASLRTRSPYSIGPGQRFDDNNFGGGVQRNQSTMHRGDVINDPAMEHHFSPQIFDLEHQTDTDGQSTSLEDEVSSDTDSSNTGSTTKRSSRAQVRNAKLWQSPQPSVEGTQRVPETIQFSNQQKHEESSPASHLLKAHPQEKSDQSFNVPLNVEVVEEKKHSKQRSLSPVFLPRVETGMAEIDVEVEKPWKGSGSARAAKRRPMSIHRKESNNPPGLGSPGEHRRGVRFRTGSEEAHADINLISDSVTESEIEVQNAKLNLQSVPFLTWRLKNEPKQRNSDETEKTLVKILSSMNKSLLRNERGRLYSRGYKCTLGDLTHRQQLLRTPGFIRSNEKIDNETSSSLRPESSQMGSKHNKPSTPSTDFSKQPYPEPPGMKDLGVGSGSQWGGSSQDPTRKSENPTNPHRKSKLLNWSARYEMKLMKDLIDVSNDILRAFIPDTGSPLSHHIPVRFWGAVDAMCRHLTWHMINTITTSSRQYVIRDFDKPLGSAIGLDGKHKHRQAWATCTACRSGKTYATAAMALKHLHLHRECVVESQNPPDDPCFVWLQVIFETEIEQPTQFGVLAALDDFLDSIVSVRDQLNELHGLVANAWTEKPRKKEPQRPPLPTNLVDAFGEIVIMYIVQAQILSSYNTRIVEAEDLGIEPQPRNINLRLGRLQTWASEAHHETWRLLQDAKKDVILLGTTSQEVDNLLGVEAVGAEFLLLSLMASVQNRKLLPDFVLASRNSNADYIEMYRSYTTRLHIQASRRPQKRLFLDINALQEELAAVSVISSAQTKLLSNLLQLLSPRSLRITNATRIGQFRRERVFARQQQRKLRARAQDMDDLSEKTVHFKERVRQTIEIVEEDHGKAIRVFTIVTLFFLPMSFVTSFMGMNTADIRDMNFSQAIFWSTSLPVTAVVVVAAVVYGYKGDEIGDWVGERLLPTRRWFRSSVQTVTANRTGTNRQEGVVRRETFDSTGL